MFSLVAEHRPLKRPGPVLTETALGVEELVPTFGQVVVIVRPLVPDANGGATLGEGAAVSEVALLDAAVLGADPRLALVPEVVLILRHSVLDRRHWRVVALLRHGDRRRAGEPVVGVSQGGFVIWCFLDDRDADRPGTVALDRDRVFAVDALRLDCHDRWLPGVGDHDLLRGH